MDQRAQSAAAGQVSEASVAGPAPSGATQQPIQDELQTLKALLRKLPKERRPLDPESQQVVVQAQQIAAKASKKAPQPPAARGEEPTAKAARQAAQAQAGGSEAAPASAAAAELEVIDQYKLVSKLGEGGMGAVYKALHTRLNKHVALKVLPASRMQDTEAVARFEREMRAVGALDHPHIVRAMDAGEFEGTHYLVMELVQGADVGEVVSRQGPLPVADACEIIRQAALGLQHAYENGLVHRDIKPSNLMLASGPQGVQVKILDLGLALLEEQQNTAAGELTASGQIMGTVDYMAPEQAGDTHAVDIRADIYSLGAALYRLLTGRVPHHSPQYTTTVKKLLALTTQDPPRIDTLRPELPPQLVQIVHCMLARQPEQRFTTPQAVADALAPLAAEADLQALLHAAQGAEGGTASQPGSTLSKADDHPTGSIHTAALPVAGHGYTNWGLGGVPQIASVSSGNSPPWYRNKVIVACAALVPLLLLGAILLVLRTPYGEVVIELADGIPAEAANQLKIEVSGNGQLKVADAQQGWNISVAEGTYQVQLAGGSDTFQLDRSQVTVSRDHRAYLKVSLKPVEQVANAATQPATPQPPSTETAPAQPAARPQRQLWKPDAQQQAFFDHVRTLPPEQQVQVVAKKLQEINPDYDGKFQHQIVSGRVTELRIATVEIADLWPVRALTALQLLHYTGGTSTSKLANLAPLAGLELKELNLGVCYNINDLAPLAGMPLAQLTIHGTNITDLSPLEGMPLKMLSLRGWIRLTDLSPLRGMLLSYLDLADCRSLSDISPLQDMPLETLLLRDSKIADLSPLREMPLKTLDITNCRNVTDLAGLAGLKLERLHMSHTQVADLTPLRGMLLTYLDLEHTRVTDLGPLAGAPLKILHYMNAPIADFSVLKDMPLESVSANRRLFDDQYDSVLRALPLHQIRLPAKTFSPIPIDQYWSQLETQRKDAHAFVKQTAALTPAERATAVQQALEEANRSAGSTRLTFSQNESLDQALLVIVGIAPRDLSPVMALTSLKRLTISGDADVQDLSCLTFLPLEELTCPVGMARTNQNVLRTIASLKTVNGQPVTPDASTEAMAPRPSEPPRVASVPRTPIPDEPEDEPKKREPWKPSDEQLAFFRQVAGLPAGQQAAAVAHMLQRVNPRYDGKYEHQEQLGRVVRFVVAADALKEIWPIRALQHLEVLECQGQGNDQSPLSDLAPLEGLRLKEFRCQRTSVTDLSPLAGMPLQVLNIARAPVSDLTPLTGMRLVELNCGFCPDIEDLSPLLGMPLRNLHCPRTAVSDLTALKGMPLRELNCAYCTGIQDLSPLAGMPLQSLNLKSCQVADLSPLRRMPLSSLDIDFCTGVTDLSPLRGMPLTILQANQTGISDLGPLQGMRLTRLEFEMTGVADLSPLRNMPIQRLNAYLAPVGDYSPLRTMKLQELTLTPRLFDDHLDQVFRALRLRQIRVTGTSSSFVPVAKFATELVRQRKAAQDYAQKAAQMPVEERVRDIELQLTRLNPGDGARLTYALNGGQVDDVQLVLASDALQDISPVMALADLKRLTITGGHPSQDLTCLKDLPLVELECPDAMVFTNQVMLRGTKSLKTINGQPAAMAIKNAQP